MKGLKYLEVLSEEKRLDHFKRRFSNVVNSLETATTSKEHSNVLMKKLFSILTNNNKLSDRTTVLMLISTTKQVGDGLCKQLLNAVEYIKSEPSKRTLLMGIDLYAKQIDLIKDMKSKEVEDWHFTHFFLLILETLVWLLSVRNEIVCEVNRYKGSLFKQFKLKRLRKKLYI